MEIRYPTAEEIEDAKALAAKVGRQGVVQLVYRTLGVCLLVRALTPTELGRVMDVQISRNQRDAHAAALIDATLWSSAPREEIVRRFPALPKEVWKQLERMAGVLPQDAEVCDLAEADARVLQRARLPESTRDLLLATNEELALVVMPALPFACVLAAPDQATFDAAQDELDTAKVAGKGFLEAATRAMTDAIVWSSEPAPAAFERWPGVPTAELLGVWARLGGAGAAVEAKSV